MSEEFKLNFNSSSAKTVGADFRDSAGNDCVLKGLAVGQVALGYLRGDRIYLTRQMAKAIGFAPIRFEKNGTLAEPTPEQQMAHFKAVMDEQEQYDELQSLVATFAREFVRANDPGNRALARVALDQAVENLEKWEKEHSEGSTK